MAEWHTPSGPQALEKIKKEISCAMCLELYEEPKTLPACLHTFCKACLLQAEAARRRHRKEEASQSADRIECPQCRSLSVVEGGVEGITTNFMYANIINHIELESGENSFETRASVPKTATVAPSDGASTTQQHQYMCRKHPDEKLKLFCFDCDDVICRDCTVKLHRDHNFDFIHEVAVTEREKLRSLVLPLEDRLCRVSDAIESARVARREVAKIGEEREAEINSAFDHCIQLIKEKRKSLLEQSHSATSVKLKTVGHHEDELESLHSQITGTVGFATGILDTASDVEVFSHKKEISLRVRRVSALCDSTALRVGEEDRAKFVMDARCLEGLGAIVEVPCTEKSIVEGVAQLSPIQGEESTVSVLAHNEEGRVLVHGGGACSAQLSYIQPRTGKPHSTQARVTDNNDGSYTVGFTPEFPGEASLEVCFSKQPLDGSPFDMNVVRSFKNVTLEPFQIKIPNANPWGVTMLNDTEIAVSASDSMVHIYATDGEELGTIRSNFTRPYGIGSDSPDTLWVTDREAHNVQKFSRRPGAKFEKVFQFGLRGVNPGQFFHPRGIAIHPDTGNIYVSDMKNNRIQVFSPDSPVPRYRGHFGGPGRGPGFFNLPAGLCFDRKNRLLVCDDHNSRVQIFDVEGRFLKTLGTTPTGRGILCSPISVSCDPHGRYIITEFGSHTISFMSPEGEMLSCVRDLGPEYGQLIHPRGVTCDSRGYVYVADHENMRIARF